MKHLTTVLALLKEHHFYAKESKCDFGMVRVEYLGHAISGQGLSTGGSNVELAGTAFKELRAVGTIGSLCESMESVASHVPTYFQKMGSGGTRMQP